MLSFMRQMREEDDDEEEEVHKVQFVEFSSI